MSSTIMLVWMKPMPTPTCHLRATLTAQGPAARPCPFHRLRRWLGPAVCLLGLFVTAGAMAQTQDEAGDDGATRVVFPDPPMEMDWGVGYWIWGPVTHDKQTCRLWRSFEVPRGAKVANASIRISVDNGYRLMLDGREIGTGSDWRSITEYDISRILRPGRHVVAVEGFNDNREAGMQFGMKIEMTDGSLIKVLSDSNWRVAPTNERDWASRTEVPVHWGKAVKVGALLPRDGQWATRVPTMVLKVTVPPPVKMRFWQQGWFQVVLWITVALAVLLCLRLMARLAVQSKAQDLLGRERARIARDIHDELGARLTELALEGEVIQTELPADSPVGSKLEALCEKARAVSGAMDEVVWVVNSRRDTLRDFATYACKHAQRFLAASPIRCRLDVDPDLPQVAFELPLRRSLLLGVKEALNNAVKYSHATEVLLSIHRRGQALLVVIGDNGEGFDLDRADRSRNGLTNMAERMKEVGGECRIITRPGSGCRVEFQVPLPRSPRRALAPGAGEDPALAAIRGTPPTPVAGKKIPSS